MFLLAVATSPKEVSCVSRAAAYDTAAAATSAEPNRTFSQAASTVSPARSSMHDKAGGAVTDSAGWGARAGLAVSEPKPRMVAATATPIASSVITVNAPLATDLSARSKVISRTSAKKPAAARVSHIGNAGERQISSSDDGQAQFMAMSPSLERKVWSEKSGAESLEKFWRPDWIGAARDASG